MYIYITQQKIGYSKLASILAEQGSIGAELLSKTMNGYLDMLIDVITKYGGDLSNNAFFFFLKKII